MPVKTFRNITWTAYHDTCSPVFWDSGTPLRKLFKYVAFSLETTEAGIEHLQGFAVPWHPASLTALRTAIQSQWTTAHIEPMKGSVVCNEAYCSKEGRLQEYGVKPNEPGVTNALLNYKHEIDLGKRVLDIAEDDKMFGTYCQYRGGLKEYEQHKRAKAFREAGYKRKHVEIITGLPGVGKTRSVFDTHGYANVYTMPDKSGKWAGSYDGQPAVVFNDVASGDIMPITTFLEWTDGHPIEVPVKGGYTIWSPEHIYFTSNQSFANWWPTAAPDHITAAVRRVTVFKDMSANVQPDAQAQV